MSASNTIPTHAPASVLGFDYGTKKIGLATGQSITGTATPIAPISANDGIPNWDTVGKLIAQWQPAVLLVGLPVHMDGQTSELTRRANKFANRLVGRFNIPTFTSDERLTTYSAKQEWSELAAIYGWPKQFIDNHWIDSLAAAMIVQSWYRLIAETH